MLRAGAAYRRFRLELPCGNSIDWARKPKFDTGTRGVGTANDSLAICVAPGSRKV
jgi:hypothetical protein